MWAILAEHFSPGQHVLELACGTGEDAIWLARHDLRVTAIDGSAQMIQKAQAKAEAAGVSDRVEVVQASLQQIGKPLAVSGQQLVNDSHSSFVIRHSSLNNGQFDAVFSNFGGLNTIDNWRLLAESLSKLVRPGGKVVLVPMGPICPWEILWHLAHGQPKAALRRFGPASAQIGGSTIPIWYPSAKRLRADFDPWFEHLHTESLGLWLPPSYLDHFVDKWPPAFAKINRFEKASAWLTKDWGDHYIIIFKRREQDHASSGK